MSRRVIAQQAAPPGSPNDGDIYLVAASGSGVWTGLDQRWVEYRTGWPTNSGWIDVTPVGGEVCWNESGRGSKGEILCYSSDEDEWFPVQERWSATQHWTGKYQQSGEKIYSKTVLCDAWPNATNKSWSIGATGTIDFSLGVRMFGTVVTAASQFDIHAGSHATTYDWSIRARSATSELQVTNTWNMSGYDALVRVEYSLT